MKKLTAILLMLCISGAIVGCSDTASTTKEKKTTETTKQSTPPGKTP